MVFWLSPNPSTSLGLYAAERPRTRSMGILDNLQYRAADLHLYFSRVRKKIETVLFKHVTCRKAKNSRRNPDGLQESPSTPEHGNLLL